MFEDKLFPVYGHVAAPLPAVAVKRLPIILSLVVFLVGLVTVIPEAVGVTLASKSTGNFKHQVHFEDNKGQVSEKFDYVARGSDYTVLVSSSELAVLPNNSDRALFIRFLGSQQATKKISEKPLSGIINYVIGSDKSKWLTNVPTYESVKYQDVYSGIDLVFYDRDGQLQFDFNVEPGIAPDKIVWRVEGAADLRIDEKGDLVGTLAAQEFRFTKPILYQKAGNGKKIQQIEGEYILHPDKSVSFRVGKYDTTRLLTIDPVVVYSSFLGGGGTESVSDVAVDTDGNMYLFGATTSPDFPVSPTVAFSNFLTGSDDLYVAKLALSGALVFATYIGGSGVDTAAGIKVNASGIYLAGTSSSTDYPTTPNAFQTAGQGIDGFVTKLDPTGGSLIYSTYLGGPGRDQVTGMDVNADGEVYVTGGTCCGGSIQLPTVNAVLPNYPGGNASVFVSKLSADGSHLIYSTFLGGSGTDFGNDIAVDDAGDAFIVGVGSNDFPLVNPLFIGQTSGFLTKIDSDGSPIIFSTRLGFSSQTLGEVSVAVDVAGDVYVGSSTPSHTLPLSGGVQDTRVGISDAFIIKYASDGHRVLYSTFLGGGGLDSVVDIAVDAASNVYIVGGTGINFFNPALFPQSNTPFPPSIPPPALGRSYIASIRPGFTPSQQLRYSVVMPAGIQVTSVAAAITEPPPIGFPAETAVFAGQTTSSFPNPTLSAFQGMLNGPRDAFVMQITQSNVLPPGSGLSISKVDFPDPVLENAPLTYTTIVTNNDSVTATELTVTDTLPLGFAAITATITPAGVGACSGFPVVTCTIPSLLGGSSATITISGTAPLVMGMPSLSLTNNVSLVSTTPSVMATATAITTVVDACANDVTNLVTVRQGGFRRIRRGGPPGPKVGQEVLIFNSGNGIVLGPLGIILVCPAGSTVGLIDKTGDTSTCFPPGGSDYLDVDIPSGPILGGESNPLRFNLRYQGTVSDVVNCNLVIVDRNGAR